MSTPISEIIQNFGVLASLWFVALTFLKDRQDRQISNLFSVSDRGDALWDKVKGDPKLMRVLAYEADLSQPPTMEEEECLIRIFKLFQDGWRVASATDKDELECLARDIADFLKRPLPRAVWEHEKVFKNRRFVRFVARAVEACGRA